MGKVGFKYFFVCIGLNLMLGGLEILIGYCISDYVLSKYTTRLLIYAFLLVLFNPIITYILADALNKDFKFEQQ